MNNRYIIFQMICLWLLLAVTAVTLAHEEQDLDANKEPLPGPLVELNRTGHLDISAEKRLLSWRVADPERIKSIQTQLLKIETGSMKAIELMTSDKLSGQVDLSEYKRGPGLYALLVKARDRDGREEETGIRLSYTELNPKCPTDKAWWPSNRSRADIRATDNSTDKRLPGFNLAELSRQASHVIAATAGEFITCPTKEGSLFTYIMFKDIRNLQQEKGVRELPQDLILRIPGGMAHGRVEIVTDAPIFKAGDRAILFLSRDPSQQVPIVHSADGVFLIEDDGVRAYSGPYVTSIDRESVIELDPGYQPNVEHARHWDPNMRATWNEPESNKPIGKPQPTKRESAKPLGLSEFVEELERAWAMADRMGRLPVDLENVSRLSYNQLPRAPRVEKQ